MVWTRIGHKSFPVMFPPVHVWDILPSDIGVEISWQRVQRSSLLGESGSVITAKALAADN